MVNSVVFSPDGRIEWRVNGVTLGVEAGGLVGVDATDDQPALEGYRGHGVFTYFVLCSPVAVLGAGAPAGLDVPSEPTHVVIAEAELFETADGGPAIGALKPGTQVRLMEAAGNVALVARDGRTISYVPAAALLRLQ